MALEISTQYRVADCRQTTCYQTPQGALAEVEKRLVYWCGELYDLVTEPIFREGFTAAILGSYGGRIIASIAGLQADKTRLIKIIEEQIK